ncbi:Crp/Fnr family transcriptional regulator [Aliihoeflea sp. PC F10.4]
MLLIEKVILLKALDFFAETPEEILAELAAASETREFADGDLVWNGNSADRNLYIIASGNIAVRKDGTRTLSLGTGDMFGELSLLGGGTSDLSGAGLSDGTLLIVPQVAFDQLVADHAVTTRCIMSVLARRLMRSSAVQRSARLEDDVLGGLQERLSQSGARRSAVGERP